MPVSGSMPWSPCWQMRAGEARRPSFSPRKTIPAELQTFVNTILAQGWHEAGAEIDESALAVSRRAVRPRSHPERGIGADCRHRSAGRSRRSARSADGRVMARRSSWGISSSGARPDDNSFWFEIDELLRTRWTHPLGGQLRIDACAVDSGDGEWTDKVYSFCFPRASRRVMAIKGVSGTRPSIQVSKGKVKGGRIWLVGVRHHQNNDLQSPCTRTLDPVLG